MLVLVVSVSIFDFAFFTTHATMKHSKSTPPALAVTAIMIAVVSSVGVVSVDSCSSVPDANLDVAAIDKAGVEANSKVNDDE